MRLWVAIIGGLAITAVSTMPAVAVPHAGVHDSRPVTRVVSTSPVEADGGLKTEFTVKHFHAGADCVSDSPVTGTAFRCFTSQAKQSTDDPCWVESNSSYVACLAKPWERTVTVLKVDGGYDTSTPMRPAGMPWGLRLATAQRHRCLVFLGATYRVRGHQITYVCDHHIVIGGPIGRSSQRWSARAYHLEHGRTRSLGRVGVATGWTGAPSIVPRD